MIAFAIIFLYEFNHTVAQQFWDNPANHAKNYDGWILGDLSGIDVYNSCFWLTHAFLICIGIVVTIPWGGFYVNNQQIVINKEIIIGFLVSLEAFVSPLLIQLNLSGQVPDKIQTLSMLFTAILVGITYFQKFLGYKKTET